MTNTSIVGDALVEGNAITCRVPDIAYSVHPPLHAADGRVDSPNTISYIDHDENVVQSLYGRCHYGCASQ